MLRLVPLLLLCGLAACGGAEEPAADGAVELPAPSGPPVVQQVEADAPHPEPAAPGLRWESVSAGDGGSLRLIAPGGDLLMSLACASGKLVAHVPAFAPIGSEDRFSLALGEEPITLVADPTDQAERGVTGKGAVPADFADLIARANRVGAVYGSQRSGPHEAPPEAQSRAFAAACT